MNNNPLKQYFRRPAVYLKLPSGGKGYNQDTLNTPETGELPVYPMTAIDEITSRTPDALFNGAAVVDLIKSCVPDIKDPWQINSNDLDAVLIAIRAASGGNDLEIESICPKCQNDGKYGVNLVAVLASMKSGDYDSELKINDLHIKFRPLTYKEMNEAGKGQFEVQRMFASIEAIEDEAQKASVSESALRRVTELTMALISQAIEYIKTPTALVNEKEYILDFLKNCDKTMYVTIRDHNTMLKSQTELKPLDITCVNCENQYEQPFMLNPTDFFA